MPVTLARRTLLLASAACIAAIPVSCCKWGSPGSKSDRIGTHVAERSEQTIDGTAVRFPQNGKVMVVDFWATWCGPCHALIPELEKIWTQHRAEGLVMVGVESGGPVASVSAHVRRLGVTYPTVIDRGGAIQRAYEVETLPHTVVLDRSGLIVSEVVGMSGSGVREIGRAVNSALKA